MDPSYSPFDDPSVLAASKSTDRAPTPLTRTDMTTTTQLPPPAPVPSPAMSGITINQQSRNIPPEQVAPPPTTINQPNLIDELGQSIKSTETAQILKAMRLINLFLAGFTVFAGVFCFIMGAADEFRKVISAIYVVTFGALLLVFELRYGAFDDIIKKNFGFMYGYKSRTMFLIFMAIWPISMGNHWITILDSVFLFLNAFFNLYVVYNHPAFSNIAPPYQMEEDKATKTGP